MGIFLKARESPDLKNNEKINLLSTFRVLQKKKSIQFLKKKLALLIIIENGKIEIALN